jgi:nucleoside phosphorylase
MRIRRAEAADEEALAQIRRSAILALAVPAISMAQAEQWATQAAVDRIARAIRNHEVWVAVEDVFAPLLVTRQALHQQFGAEAIDMESGAMAQVCWVQEVPFVAIRGISDTNDTAITQIQTYAALAMQNALKLVANLLAHWL